MLVPGAGAGAGAVSWLCTWWRQGAGAGAVLVLVVQLAYVRGSIIGSFSPDSEPVAGALTSNNNELPARAFETGCWCWCCELAVHVVGAGCWLCAWWRQGAGAGAGAAGCARE